MVRDAFQALKHSAVHVRRDLVLVWVEASDLEVSTITFAPDLPQCCRSWDRFSLCHCRIYSSLIVRRNYLARIVCLACA